MCLCLLIYKVRNGVWNASQLDLRHLFCDDFDLNKNKSKSRGSHVNILDIVLCWLELSFTTIVQMKK